MIYAISLTILLLAGVLASKLLLPNHANSSDHKDPFLIHVNSVKIENENPTETGSLNATTKSEISKYLVIDLSIENIYDGEYRNTKYSMKLNHEVTPFIASGIISFESERFWVAPKSIAAESRNTLPLKVTGFVHNWNLLLTSEADLETYHGKKFSELPDHLKSIEVQVKWSGGMQTEILPINLDEISLE
jgi:hypothetical protein